MTQSHQLGDVPQRDTPSRLARKGDRVSEWTQLWDVPQGDISLFRNQLFGSKAIRGRSPEGHSISYSSQT